jgi:hypothetical protein
VQVAGDVLLVPRERWPPKVEGFDETVSRDPWVGLRSFDVSEPLARRALGSLAFEPDRGDGAHRTVWTGGRYAHGSLYADGVLGWLVLDLAPTPPAPRRPLGGCSTSGDRPASAGTHTRR